MTPAIAQSPHRWGWGLPIWSLYAREVLRFVRQRNRVIGSLGTPLLFWIMLGSGFGESLRAPGAEKGVDYMAFFFPGTLMLVVLFTAIFSSMSVIQDRREGFLQGVLVAPVPRLAIVLGKVMGGATLSLAQGLLMLLLAPLAGISLSFWSVLAAGGIIFLTALGLSALGFLLAWRMDSVQGFHAVMNLLLMPMWFLSGALFPAAGASTWVQWVMAANPLGHGMIALRGVLSPLDGVGGGGLVEPGTALWVVTGFAVGMLLLAAWVVSRPERQ